MSKRTISASAAWLSSFLIAASVSAQTSDRPDGMRFLPDVRAQFLALTERADALGFHLGDTPDPSTCKHYQSMVRVNAADGTPYFLVTRSGNIPTTIPFPGAACDDSDGETDNGHLIVVRMDSRPNHGERLRSNRMLTGLPVDFTPPRTPDRGITYFTVIGGDPADPDPAGRPGLVPGDDVGTRSARVYQHPGGMALVGNMLAVALEHPRGFDFDLVPQTQIMFFDVSNPEAPVFTSRYAPINGAGEVLTAAGVVAVTPLPGGRYLMLVTGGQNSSWRFYRSTLTNLASPDLSWDYLGAIAGASVEDPHQTLTFLRQGDINGPLYLAGARGHAAFDDRDRIDLYEVTCPVPDCEGGGMAIDEAHALRGKRISPFPLGGGLARLVNLAAASAFYVSPSGELIFYATEHDNDGPNGTVKAGEWRHVEVVREDSPTLSPTATVDGPFEVDEGGSVTLTGSAGPPVTRAFLQLFTGFDFGGAALIADIDDIHFDDFTNLADVARSWNWYAPPDCTAFAIDLDTATAKTLPGAGVIRRDPDLRQVMNDAGTGNMDLRIDEIGFDMIGCGQYYEQAFSLRWDLDVDGTFETAGNAVTFDARAFDGPSEVMVPARAQDTSVGSAGTAAARVSVRNVAPHLSQFHVTDSAGGQVNTFVPFVLTNLPVTAAGVFSDPGVLDRQTAALSWGDGSVDANSAFASFDEAFGDGTGSASHTHRYPLAGSYAIALSVRDDDGGEDVESVSVRVVTPEQAVEEIVGLIDAAITGASEEARKDLEKARRALAGSHPHSENGALKKIAAGQVNAAMAFLQQAVSWVSRAEASGADLAVVSALLEQVISALTAA